MKWVVFCMGFLLAVTPATMAADGAPDQLPPGWAGADLAEAQILAEESGRPILILARQPNCPACDEVESVLTTNSEIAVLSQSYIRLRLSMAQPQGRDAAAILRISRAPTILLMGPGGMEASRREGRIEDTWLWEQMSIVARRHQDHDDTPHPDQAALQLSRQRLEEWGDEEGSAKINERLTGEAAAAAGIKDSAGDIAFEFNTITELSAYMDRVDDPTELRRLTHRLALLLEQEGRPGMSMQAYRLTIDKLLVDPLSEARSAFLASRHNLPLEPVLANLTQAREDTPGHLGVLMAEARVAEQLGRIFRAFHAVEAAAVYAPDDAWIALEYHRLRLMIRLSSRHISRDPA